MAHGEKGIDIFLAGMTISFVTFYLSGLSTGPWIPLVVFSAALAALVMMAVGLKGFIHIHPLFQKTKKMIFIECFLNAAAVALVLASMEEIFYWTALAFLAVMFLNALCFLAMAGTVFFAFANMSRSNGELKQAEQMRYLWVVYLFFSVVDLIFQGAGVFLVNNGLGALTYMIPALGILPLGLGIFMVFHYLWKQPKEMNEDK